MNRPSVDDRFAAITQANTKEELSTQLVEFAHSLGFAYAALTYVVEGSTLQLPTVASPTKVGAAWDSAVRSHDGTAFLGLTITNEQFLSEFLSFAEKDAKPDPVMSLAKVSSLPIIWSEETYLRAGAPDLYDQLKMYGIANGIITALHLPNNEHLVIGFDGPDKMSRDAKVTRELTRDLQVFTTLALTQARSILLDPLQNARKQSYGLTLREVEVLKWCTDGKTADEIGTILGISGGTAAKHTASAISKLECINIKSAIAKALREGLLR